MIVNAVEHDYKVTFRYGWEGDKTVTTCEVFSAAPGQKFKDHGTVIGQGVAVCDSRDNFCKEIGRKLSMTRALRNTDLSKQERQLIWENYFDR